MIRWTKCAVLIGMVSALGACADDECEAGACTMEFRTFSVAVVNDAGEPVAGLEPVVTLVRTGAELDFSNAGPGDPENGVYMVMTDGHGALIEQDEEAVRFTATTGGLSATGDFAFGMTMCRCHVEQVSGPDTLVMR
jgi:hypothetical protein